MSSIAHDDTARWAVRVLHCPSALTMYVFKSTRAST